MVNRKRIGDYYERKVVKKLESEGFVVYKPVRTKFGPKDIFGLFDLEAWHPQKGYLSFIQVKKHKKEYTKEVIKKFEEFASNLSALFVELTYFEKGCLKKYQVSTWVLKKTLSSNGIKEPVKDLKNKFKFINGNS